MFAQTRLVNEVKFKNIERMKFMKVYNINGTSDNDCKCGSWKNHWINYGGKSWPKYCSEKSCLSAPEVGAHVQKASGSADWYIIPLCKAHNKTSKELEVSDSTTLVSANRGKTCGY